MTFNGTEGIGSTVTSGTTLTNEVPGVVPVTGLATDYLNHFYEPLLLLEHCSDNPDLLDDLADWTPNSYVGHFGQSARADRAIILSAYMEADPGLRRKLDRIAEEAGHATAKGVNTLLFAAQAGDDVSKRASALADVLRHYIRMLDSIIGGHSITEPRIRA